MWRASRFLIINAHTFRIGVAYRRYGYVIFSRLAMSEAVDLSRRTMPQTVHLTAFEEIERSCGCGGRAEPNPMDMPGQP